MPINIKVTYQERVEGFNALTLNPPNNNVFQYRFYKGMSWNLQSHTGGSHES
jgi:hypothetical protein